MASTSPLPPTEETLPPTRGKSHIVLQNPCPQSLSRAGLSWHRKRRKFPRGVWWIWVRRIYGCGHTIDEEWGRSLQGALGQGQTRLSCSRAKDWQTWSAAQLLYWALCQCWVSSVVWGSLIFTKDFILDQVPAGHNSCKDTCPFFFCITYVHKEKASTAF